MRRRYSPLPPICLADAAGIHHAAVHIDAGLSSGRIDPDAGPVLLWVLQMAKSLNRAISRYKLPSSARADPAQVANQRKPHDFYHLQVSPLNRKV
jgi:hypothetical protein